MKKKNGFTLIELLAILVILAIIAVITIPKINKVINESKQNAARNSAYGYKDAIEKWEASQQEDDIYLNGNYTITNGKLDNYTIPITGSAPSSGYLTYEDDDLISGCLVINGYEAIYQNGKFTSTRKGNCGGTEAVIPEPGEIEPGGTEPVVPEPVVPEFSEPTIVTSGDGLYESTTEPGRLIYRGSNPKNYINIKEDGINNTLYRIVSFEADGTIKVVRNESIGKIAWDAQNARYSDGTNNTYCTSSRGCNVWGNQTNTLYNGSPLGDNFHYIYYEDSTTLTNGPSGKVGSDSTLNQYLNSKTNNPTNSWQPAIVLDQYIDNHSWNVGGTYKWNSDKGVIKEKEEERQLKWTGKIALLNITEFVEASTYSGCTGVRASTNRDNPCKGSNWVNKGIYEWSLSPYTNYRYYVWIVSSEGYFESGDAYSSLGVRPAFYLKSGISLTGGGTYTNPYNISNM